MLGQIIYFFASYFAYEDFEDKKLKRVGGKVKLQTIFSWIQFNLSMMKTDLGMILFLLITTIVFDYKAYAFLIIDIIIVVLSGAFIFFMNSAVNIFI